MATKNALPSVAIVLRKNSRFKTWLQRIKGANTANAKSKNGKVYDFVVEYPDPMGETAIERAYRVGPGWYMIAQPSEDGTGREIERFVVDSTGSIRRNVSEDEMRSHFGLGAKQSNKAASKPAYMVPDNAVRF